MPANAKPRIALPMPHSLDREYAERAIPQYERAVEQAGGVPVRIALELTPAEVMKIIQGCNGVLLPGSKADVDPARFGAARSPHTAGADARRDAVDDLLLEDAYHLRKPVLGICYGLQSLNVFRAGSLIQHIPEFLPEELRGRVDHEAGKTVAVVHSVEIDGDSKLAVVLCGDGTPRRSNRAQLDIREDVREGHDFSRAVTALLPEGALAPAGAKLVIPVNSSHHQSAETIGKGLRVSARCTGDGIVEALEGTDPDHFVLAVQWHPERSIDLDEPSRAIFRALIAAAQS